LHRSGRSGDPVWITELSDKRAALRNPPSRRLVETL
jgi:hypothetical protein